MSIDLKGPRQTHIDFHKKYGLEAYMAFLNAGFDMKPETYSKCHIFVIDDIAQVPSFEIVEEDGHKFIKTSEKDKLAKNVYILPKKVAESTLQPGYLSRMERNPYYFFQNEVRDNPLIEIGNIKDGIFMAKRKEPDEIQFTRKTKGKYKNSPFHSSHSQEHAMESLLRLKRF